MKTYKSLRLQEKEKYTIPRKVQDFIPVTAIYGDGIFRCGNKFTKSWRFTDINYLTASHEDKEDLFLKYSELLNTLDSGATAKITLNNRVLNRADFEENILLPDRLDALREYRQEYNNMLLQKAAEGNNIMQEKYITVSVFRRDVDEAREYFSRIGAELGNRFRALGSDCTALDITERMRILHDFYRSGDESSFRFDMKEMMRKGHDFKDYICPDSFERADDYIRIGDKYARVLFLKEYASYIRDSLVSNLCGLSRKLMLSIDINPIPMEEAMQEAERRLLGVETNITNWQRRQNQNQNFSAELPYDMKLQRQESADFLKDLAERDQRMMYATITLVHMADSKAELDSDTESLKSVARKHLCQLAVLRFQQMEGLNTVLPIGCRKLNIIRTLTTESLAVFMPFKAQEICHKNGIYYGQNSVSRNMIIADRKELLNGNSFILGVSGSGKSFAGKCEIASLMLDGNSDIIIIDPEREYGPLVKALGGEIVDISATSKNHINALDINRDYGDGEDPVILKSEFILSLCEQLMGSRSLGMKEKSILDRCAKNVYRDFKRKGYEGYAPTLRDFRSELLEQEEEEAKDIALALELFTDGSLNTFAKRTNVNTDSRLICYDILDLGKQLRPIGMLVVLDSILNRITKNRAEGKNTFIFIDEIYLLFQHEYSAVFLETLWKRVRKYGAFCTGITQNVDDLLQSYTARTMLANSEFVIMLNQAATDRIKLAELMGIAENQQQHITNAEAGCGLMKVGSALVPFENRFPKNTKLYGLMTTKFGEKAGAN